ncbi:MAG: DUF4157 domain-containing protein [Methanothrix sp.]|nr:DUF4157 domain-containing protein [Methanothrix sp.]
MVETISSPDHVQRKADASLRRKIGRRSSAGGIPIGPDVELAIQRARSGGMPIPDSVRQPMERAFGADFGRVRLHDDAQADRLNRSIQARAFTTGRDIFLRQGEYRPASSEGQRLLAHELTHVVQQMHGQRTDRVRVNDDQEGRLMAYGMVLKTSQMACSDQAAVRLTSQTSTQLHEGTRPEYPFPVQESALKPGLSLANPTIQRTVTQILPGPDKKKIGSLLIVGRPDKVFINSMGDHTTAFATHVAAIRLRMENKSLWEALKGLKELYEAATKLEGYSMKGNLPSSDVMIFGNAKPHGNRLKSAEDDLIGLFKSLPKSQEEAGVVDQTELALKLQESVNAYLEFRELIPLSAINVMYLAPGVAGKGKGEAENASILAQYERGTTFDKETLRKAILGVFDVNAAAMVVAATDPHTLAAIAPGLNPTLPLYKRVELLASQHLTSISAGFPRSSKEANVSIKELSDYIIKRAKAELENNRRILALRYARRLQKYQEIKNGIESKILKTKYDRDMGDRLDIEVKSYKEQIEMINKALGSDIEIPAKIINDPSEREEEERLIKEQGEAQDREEESVEQEQQKQPIAIQILLKKSTEGTASLVIGNIEIAGRPPSPISGSMGAHTTAWVLHTDRIKKALVGERLESALNIINKILVPEAFALQEELASANPPVAIGQLEKMIYAKEAVIKWSKKEINEYNSASDLAFSLQQYLDELLIYINYIPGVTREAVNTAGRGEGKHRRVLIEYENLAEIEQKRIELKAKKKTPRKPIKNLSFDMKSEKTVKLMYKPTKEKCEELEKAVDGLLDLKGLENKNIYTKSHWKMIKYIYPYTWNALNQYKRIPV